MRRLLLISLILALWLSGCTALPTGAPPLPAAASATPAPAAIASSTTTPPAAGLTPAPATEAAVTAAGGATPAPAPAATATVSPTRTSLDAPWDEWSTYEEALRLPEGAAETTPALQRLFRPPAAELSTMTQYHMDLALSAALDRLDGDARIRYTNRVTATLDSVYLHLFPNLWGDGMALDNVRVAGRPVSFTLQSENTLVHIPLHSLLAPGQSVEIDLRFSDPIPADKEIGNYGEFGLTRGLLALAGFYPTVVVYDEKGWHLETPSMQGDVLYAESSLYDVTLTAPAGLTVAATGVTAGRADNGDGTATWRLVGGPLRDFNIVVGAHLRSFSQKAGPITVNSYARAEDADFAQRALGFAVAAVSAFERAFGPYPYRELDVVETGTSALGIEYPGLIAIADSLYRSEARPEYLESTIVHETAHQWWYGVVGDDQQNNPWLDESTAQYSTYLYYEGAYGEAGARGFEQGLERRWQAADRAPKPIGLPVADYSEAEYSAIVYGRGPLFLIALRNQIGKDKMAEFMQRYYEAYAWRVARPADFQRLAEQISGQNLSSLFDQWVYPPK